MLDCEESSLLFEEPQHDHEHLRTRVVMPKECSEHSEYFNVHNRFSELRTKEDKQIARNNLGILESAEDKISIELPGNSATEQIAYINNEYPNLKSLQDVLDLILYKDLTITLKASKTIAEKGETLNSISYEWTVNKLNINQKLNGISLESNIRSYVLKGPFKDNITTTLSITDGLKEISKSITTYFYPGIYYGAGTLFSKNILESKKVQASRTTTITVLAKESEYIFICIPYDYGVPTFSVNGFKGGFDLVSESFSYKDSRYRVYKSVLPSLGETTISIT